ncbi:hypothetical protein EJ08DRAFT_242107 [Tothia fuscella]|uniref:F-box domain-containing protein n=1 Tax=Tothia fuscella TaxID=1048955 RepID=A0A9P4TYK6_9PEZI|nr:hypothetical protein EJ08DRAFT_242107 [Tothia fuscella]
MTKSLADRVFGITELAELIIQFLDHNDLARLQYTNRSFHSAIRTNKAFLRTYYFEPAEGGTVKPIAAPIHANPKRVRWVSTFSQNPIYTPVAGQIASSFAATGQVTSQIEDGEGTAAPQGEASSSSTPLRAVIRSTSLQKARQLLQPPVLNLHLQKHFLKWSYYPINNMIGLEEAIPATEIWRNADASWRSMLLMQPPLAEVLVMDWDGKMYRARCERGVTMGVVVDAIENGEVVDEGEREKIRLGVSVTEETIEEE